MSTGRRINEDARCHGEDWRDLDLNTAFDIQQGNSWVRQ
jgi:hypothetical protein